MRIWRVLLRLSAQLEDTGVVQTIDVTGFDRVAASYHYATHTRYTFRSVRTILLVDCSINLILDIHCSMEIITRYKDRLADSQMKSSPSGNNHY